MIIICGAPDGRRAALWGLLLLATAAAAAPASAAADGGLASPFDQGSENSSPQEPALLRDVIGLGLASPEALGAGMGWPGALLIVVLAVAAIAGLVYWLSGIWPPLGRLFAPASVVVIHNPLVRQPMQILCETLDLEQIAAVDPHIAAVAGDLGYGLGIKGGIARKVLKILHGKPEPATSDFDIDCILLAEPGMTPEQETELRKTVTGKQLGHLILEPKDVEVISKGEGLKNYWIHRDICLNEVLLMRLAPGAPLTLFYSDGALKDARTSVIRSIPHALKSDFTECWCLDGSQPILSPKHVARTILRFFKGHGDSYELGEATWAYYRRTKLGPVALFQILRSVHADDEKYKEVVAHLINVGLLSSSDVRSKGGFNGLWGATLKEVNDRMAQYGGRLSIDELDVEAVERWIVNKKSRMRSLPYRQRDRASRTGYIPADEDTLGLGLITFPQNLLDYIDREGGLWDPDHPEGRPEEASAAAAAAAKREASEAEQAMQPRLSATEPLPPLLGLPSAGGSAPPLPPLPSPADGDMEAALQSRPPPTAAAASNGHANGWGLGQLAASGLGLAARALGFGGGELAGTGSGLTEPLLPPPPGSAGASPAREGRREPARDPMPRHISEMWQGGEDQEVQFIPAQTLEGAAPALSSDENRLGMAWLVEPEAGTTGASPREEDKDGGDAASEAAGPDKPRPPSRYSSAETIHFMCRIALAAWPLLALSAALIVASVGLHLYGLRVQSEILNLATSGEAVLFRSRIGLLARVSLAAVAANWLSSVALQVYLKAAMQKLYTGLFQHVLFQDTTFYDSISASELAMRTGVDMMNIRVLVGFLAQKVVKGTTQLVAGVALLAAFAGPALGARFDLLIAAAVLASMGELVGVSLVIRARHRVARSALGRLYGFSYDIFSSIHGVAAMALQRTFSDSYSALASSYFSSAMVLAVWVASHQLFLEAAFSAGVTVCLLYIGGTSLLQGTVSVGTVYALIRYTAVVEQGYVSLSEAVARFFASYGSLEHVIDLHQRGQLTNRGKPAVLEYLEREDAARQGEHQRPEPEPGATPGDWTDWSNWTRRLTAASWAGGVRCREVMYGYKGRPGHVLFAASLDVPAGGAVLVTGGPASGRSTLLHLLHLDITAGGGSVQFFTASGVWLAYHPTSTDRYEMQQRMGFLSPQACIEAVFFATIQENLVCACAQGRLPSVSDCQEAAALTGFDADVAQLPDGYQTLVGEASRVELATMARLRLGVARLLLLNAPLLMLIDDADRFLTAVPRLPEVVARLRQAGASVVLTATSSSTPALREALASDVRLMVLEEGRLRAGG